MNLSAYQQKEIAKLRRRKSRDLAREQRLCTAGAIVWLTGSASFAVLMAHLGGLSDVGHGIEILAPSHVLWQRREMIRRELNTRRGELIRVLT